MRLMSPFSAKSSRSHVTLFQIRLDNDFIVFRGSPDAAAGQVVTGVVVLCINAPLKVDAISLRLTSSVRFHWMENRHANPSSAKVDETRSLLHHAWLNLADFQPKTTTTLEPGNYEWPFEYSLPGDSPETVDGIPEAAISYRFKATLVRPTFANDLHAHALFRCVRCLEAGSLDSVHAMSVENTWPDKVDYSISIAQKAVIFGSTPILHMRFTPLLKGLDVGKVVVRLIETREMTPLADNDHGRGASPRNKSRQHRFERCAATWTQPVSREHFWRDTIDETGQEGWLVAQSLPFPVTLRACVQDVNVMGIRIKHKLKIIVSLLNPDGHVSELRATLPISVIFSANTPLDAHGNLYERSSTAPLGGAAVLSQSLDPGDTSVPPNYGDHTLDQPFDDDTTPLPSGTTSPFSAHSRSTSAEDLRSFAHHRAMGVAPAALSSLLESVPEDSAQRHIGRTADSSSSGSSRSSGSSSSSSSSSSSNHSSRVSQSLSGHATPGYVSTPGHVSPDEHIDYPDLAQLNQVPSYDTAVRTPPVRSASATALHAGSILPDYYTALSTGPSPAASPPASGRTSPVATAPPSSTTTTTPPRRLAASTPSSATHLNHLLHSHGHSHSNSHSHSSSSNLARSLAQHHASSSPASPLATQSPATSRDTDVTSGSSSAVVRQPSRTESAEEGGEEEEEEEEEEASGMLRMRPYAHRVPPAF